MLVAGGIRSHAGLQLQGDLGNVIRNSCPAVQGGTLERQAVHRLQLTQRGWSARVVRGRERGRLDDVMKAFWQVKELTFCIEHNGK